MADQRLRALERRWKETGDVSDEVVYLLERQRRGELNAQQLRLLAYVGYPAARAALAENAPEGFVMPGATPKGEYDNPTEEAFLRWLEGFETWGKEACARAAVGLVRILQPEWRERHPREQKVSGIVDAIDAWTAAPTRKNLAAVRERVPVFSPDTYSWTQLEETAFPSAVRHASAWCHAQSMKRAAVQAVKLTARSVAGSLHTGLSYNLEGDGYPGFAADASPDVFLRLHGAIRDHVAPWVLAGGAAKSGKRSRSRIAAPLAGAVPEVEIPTESFDSAVKVRVFGIRNGERVELGSTAKPGAVSLEGCQRWWVRPIGGARVLKKPERFAGIPGLDLAGFKVKDEHLAHVGRLGQLTWLSLEGCDSLTDDALAGIKGLERLRYLNLRGCRNIAGRGLRALQALPALRALILGETALGAAGYAELGELTQLETLVLDRCVGITDDRVDELASLTGLESLFLGDNDALTGKSLHSVATIAGLKALDLSGLRGVTDAGLKAFAGHDGLANLNLERCCVRGAGLASLLAVPSLRVLSLNDCPLLFDEAMPNLRELAPRLTELDMRANDEIYNGRLAKAVYDELRRPGLLTLRLEETWTSTSWPDLELETDPIDEGGWNELREHEYDDRIEPAASGRAGCRGCGARIAKGELRFAESGWGHEGEPSFRYHHLLCAARSIGDKLRPVLAAYLGEIPERAEIDAALDTGHRGVDIPRAELARSGRSRCMACDEKIDKDTLRVITERMVERVGMRPGYLHPKCALGYLEGASAEQIVANSDLPEAGRAQLRDQLEGTLGDA